MRKLEQLIQELCPNGVEYVYLKTVADIGTGSSNTNEQLETGKYPFFVRSPIVRYKNNYEFDEEAIITSGDGVGVGKIYHYINGKYALHQRAYRIHVFNDSMSTRFLFHYLKTKFYDYILEKSVSSSVTSIRKNMLENFLIPFPPLPVQEEIVRILDYFTELTAKLTAELTARKKQYEYYRNQLLDIKKVKYVKFGEIAKISRGASPRPIKSFITSESDGIPWIKIGDVEPNSKYITKTAEKITQEGSKKSKIVNKGDFILSNSMSFGRPYIVKITGCIHDGWLSISEFDKHYLSDFLYHLLSSSKYQNIMKQKASFGGAVQNLKADIVKEIEIPIISLKEQQRIVDILDRFDKLCNDISEGLPAEIEARQKQYEYYRDKLLTFKTIEEEK